MILVERDLESVNTGLSHSSAVLCDLGQVI